MEETSTVPAESSKGAKQAHLGLADIGYWIQARWPAERQVESYAIIHAINQHEITDLKQLLLETSELNRVIPKRMLRFRFCQVMSDFFNYNDGFDFTFGAARLHVLNGEVIDDKLRLQCKQQQHVSHKTLEIEFSALCDFETCDQGCARMKDPIEDFLRCSAMNKSAFRIPENGEVLMHHLRVRSKGGVVCLIAHHLKIEEESTASFSTPIKTTLGSAFLPIHILQRNRKQDAIAAQWLAAYENQTEQRLLPRAASNQQAPNYNDIAEQLNAQCQRENRLGYGSYGEVYKVNLAGQPVALKYAYPTKHEAFTKEIRFLSSLPHSHYLVSMVGVAEKSGLMLLLEYMNQGSLQDLLSKKNVLDVHQAWEISYDILKGLQFLHSSKFIHRDIKPGNILLCSHGNSFKAKLADFNTAKDIHKVETLSFAGTAKYMAPEIQSPQEYGLQTYDAKVDIYSFAICLYEMLFTWLSDWNYLEVRTDRASRPAFPTSQTLETYGFARLIQKCWNPEPLERPEARNALAKLCKILPKQILAKQEVKDGNDQIKLRIRGEEFTVRRSVLARVRRSALWELFGGGRDKDPPTSPDGFVELDENPQQFTRVIAMLQLLDVDSGDDLASFNGTLQRLALPLN